MKIKLLVLLFCTVFFSACYYDKEETLYPKTITTVDSNLTYTSNAKTVFDNNCNSCHASSSPSGGIILDNYDDAKTNTLNGHVVCSIEYTGACVNMPQGSKMSDANINIIKIWKAKNCPQ